MLYFVLADLAGVDVMYQFSLTWFQSMFVSCINMSPQPLQPKGREKSVVHMAGASRRSSIKSRDSFSSDDEDRKGGSK